MTSDPLLVGLVTGFVVVLGLLIGSFLNVVIWRVPRGESVVRPPSHCPGCDSEIGARDNIPVISWLLLGGRCRRCKMRISARYPAVELATGVLFGVMVWHFGITWQLPAFLYLAAVGVALAMIDIDHHRLPNALTWPSYVVGGVLLLLPAALEDGWGDYLRAWCAAVALFAFYLILALIYPAGMGMGDVKLAGVLGLYLGWLSWGQLVIGGFLGFAIGAVVGVGLMLVRRANRKSGIPFGPSMLAGALVGILAGQEIAHWYVGLIQGA